MSTMKLRIERLTDKLAEAGLAGKDMTDELKKLASAEDLSGNEIRRIAEGANRRVQLGLYKVAADKRFAFKLADGKAVAGEAEKQAEAAGRTFDQGAEKDAEFHSRLDAIDAAGGDPFAAPARSDLSKLSLFNVDVDAKVAEQASQIEDMSVLHELQKAAADIEAVIRESKVEAMRVKKAAVDAHGQLVQSAVDMVTHGVTLPSLYDAILAGASGSNSGVDLDSAIHQTDAIMELVIAGLKQRGIENHKMGFRHNGDPDALSKLTSDQLIALCKKHSSYQRPQDLTMADVKTAEDIKAASAYIERYEPEGRAGEGSPLRPDDALEMLKSRATQNGRFAVPQAYLDDADNLVAGAPRVYNTNDEFIVSVQDLVGAQDRLRRCHAAQEYLGLKLKKIEEATRAVAEARKTADLAIKEGARVAVADALGEEKDAFIGALAGLGRAAFTGIGNAMRSGASKAVTGVKNFAASPAGKRVGAAGAGVATGVSNISAPSSAQA